MRIINNPFDYILQAFVELYPDKTNVVIQFTDKIDETDEMDNAGEPIYGVTYFPGEDDETDTIHIYVVYTLSVDNAAEILSHELAHVAAGIENDHNEIWNAAFEKIMDHSQQLMKRAFERPPFGKEGESG